MTEETSTRRKLLAAGGATLMAGLAGCAAFRDDRGVPGKKEPDPTESSAHPQYPFENSEPPSDDENQSEDESNGEDEGSEE